MASSWSIERKSRSQADIGAGDDSRAAAADHPVESLPGANAQEAQSTPRPAARKVTKFRTRTSLFMVVFELCLCGVMIGAVATWYYYATSLVQDEAFKTRWVLIRLKSLTRVT